MSARSSDAYPEAAAERDRWILVRRGPRNPVDARRAAGAFLEIEPNEEGRVEPVATVLLANRECPWRCLMCDLWKNTTSETVPLGRIPEQIREALAELPPARRVKLYNSGSFFDRAAIPPGDYSAIAEAVGGVDRVIVESHPALVGDACLRLRDLLSPRLEVAMGLETVHPDVLPRLNKRMDLALFERAASFLRGERIAMRAFVLLGLPFLAPEETAEWTRRSLEFAFACGATAVSIVPTRAGNGALDVLRQGGEFQPPSLAELEAALAAGLALGRGRVFADLWDLERLRRCADCFAARRNRLTAMNLRQRAEAPVECASCGGDA